MTIETAKWWSKRKFGCASLALSFVEMVIMWGDVVRIQAPGKQSTHLILNVNGTIWLVAGLGSFGLAVAGLVADSHRLTAFAAAMVAIVAFFICGLQMLV